MDLFSALTFQGKYAPATAAPAMGHGGVLFGEEHGGMILDGGITYGVLAALTAVRAVACHSLTSPDSSRHRFASARRAHAAHATLRGHSPLTRSVFDRQVFWATCFVLHTSGTIFNVGLYVNGAKYMFLGKDTKYKVGAVQGDAGLISEAGAKVEDRTVIFIRHGESTWNETFNPVGINKLLFPFGLLYAFVTESYLLLTGRKDSWFYDSPLNMIGQEQASELRNYLAKDSQWPKATSQEADLKLLKGTDLDTPAIVVSSTLRRAVVSANSISPPSACLARWGYLRMR